MDLKVWERLSQAQQESLLGVKKYPENRPAGYRGQETLNPEFETKRDAYVYGGGAPRIELGKPMTEEQTRRGHQAMAKGQMEEDAAVETAESLLRHAPEVIDEHLLHNYKTNYNGAKQDAMNCEINGMVKNLLMLAETHDEIVDEMAHWLRKDVLQSKDYDKFVRLLGLFQRRTVPRRITTILENECGCGSPSEKPIEYSKEIDVNIEDPGDFFRRLGKRL